VTGKASRDKGARGERDVCARLEKELGIKFARNLKQYQQAQHGDIEPPAGPYLLEVKNQDSISAMKSWWRQACAAAAARGLLPCLVFKDRGKWAFLTPMEGAGKAWMNDVDFADRNTIRGFCFKVRERL